VSDTGPPYPHPNPVPGSNAIGFFEIGVSPIGTIPPFDFWKTVISQYANSPILTQLLENFNDYIDQTQNLDNFFDLIFNVDTAQGYGLDVWGRIVNVSRTVNIPGNAAYFGFEEASAFGFGQQSFFTGTPITSNFQLSDSAYRILIFAKALSNICDGSIPSTNQLLLNLFPNRGDCYVTDNQNMTMTYTFKFALTTVELAILEQSNVLPTPAGVSFTIAQV